MLNELNAANSKDLKLSFNFKIIKFYDRTLEIEVNGFLNKIDYSNSFFDWFIEDLIYFLDKNKFQRRWDYGLIKILNIKSFNLSKEDLEDFISKFKTITSWDMEGIL